MAWVAQPRLGPDLELKPRSRRWPPGQRLWQSEQQVRWRPQFAPVSSHSEQGLAGWAA